MNQQELKGYSLYLEDNNFFSNIFIESNEIKSFIFERYAKGSCWWMRKADLGLLKFQKSIKEKYAGNLSILANEIIGVYEEKFRDKKLIFLYSDQVFVNDIGQVSVNELDIQDGNLYCQGEPIDICLSEPVIHFIEDLKKLESYEWENDYSHPVTRLSYDSRNQYMKLLLLICVWNHGISVDQIIFLSEMAQQFGMNSGRLLEFIREIRKIPDGSIADYIQQMAIHFDETEQKTVYVDIAYLIRVGQYNENQKNVRINKISLRFVLIRMQLIQGNGTNSRKLKMIRLMCFMQDLCRQMGIIRRQIETFKKDRSIQNVKYRNEEYDNIMSKYKEVDRKADKVRSDLQKKIKSQPYSDAWYCDSEYSAARNVQAEYNVLSKEVQELGGNYDVMVTENSNSKDGYCIECTAGDECITFDRVTVVEDGKAIIDIDHKESTKGTCKASWVQIREKLSEEGLFLEDITKNGKSIFKPSSKSESASVPAEGVRSNQ